MVAAPSPATAAIDLPAPHARRGGVLFGIDAMGGLASSAGYPNDISKLDDPRFYSASGLMTGTGWSMFLMGALADYVSFGFWFGVARFGNHHWSSSGGGGGFKVDAFPLVSLVPALADLGLTARFGIGSTQLHTTVPGNYPEADGVQSYLGAGAFYEWRLFGHVVAGPELEYDAIFSRSIERHGAMIGLRLAVYGGP